MSGVIVMSELFAGTETLIDHVTDSFAETVPSAVAPSVILESKLSELSPGAVISVTGIVMSLVVDVLFASGLLFGVAS